MGGTMTELKDHEVVTHVLTSLGKKYPNPPIPVDAVDATIAKFRPVFDELEDREWQIISKIIKSQVKITMEAGVTLVDNTYEDWLAKRTNDIDWTRWGSYKQLLVSKGYSPAVLATMGAITGEVLNCLGDPTKLGPWKRRGLVIGDVQSGKTATYLGIVNRAADAGYQLIILLAGGTEALRKQTQFRVEEGLTGRDTANSNNYFGVSGWQPNGFVGAQALTTQESDFRKTSKRATSIVVDPNSPTPLVFVVKKNKTALENVRDWLKQQQLGDNALDVPMLLVDDESDYASVNTREDDSPTVINAVIREILTMSSRTSYLAFTATPFANVFIDHETEDETLGDDLFPSDYIRTLEAPSNYVGSRAYFGTENEADTSKIVTLDDVEDEFPLRHKSLHVVADLPDSLKDAIRAFVVASAIREVRGDSSPRSMLVNVSRFKRVQAQVHEQVLAEFETIRSAIELHAGSSVPGAGEHVELRRLQDAYLRHFASCPESWHDIRPQLKAAVHGTAVRLFNSERVKAVKDLADLETDRMIAVGGDVLSRGLTLEGLTVSYFHRVVGAADTLMQMARWFGYRPGYEDVCRVWIPDEVADQFRYVSSIIDDLRGQLAAMKKQNLTPTNFGLRVRMHPAALLITARNKSKSAEARPWTVSIAANSGVETRRIDADPGTAAKNFARTVEMVAAVEAEVPGTDWQDGTGSIRGTHGVPKELVASYLEDYIGFVADPLFGDAGLARFVRETTHPGLQRWTVAFVPGSGASVSLGDSLSFGRVVRSSGVGVPVEVGGGHRQDIRVSGKALRLAGPKDVAKAGEVLDGQDEPDVYGHLRAPVLLIYVLEPKAKSVTDPVTGRSHEDTKVKAVLDDLNANGLQPLVGVKVGVPGKPGDRSADVNYLLNSVALAAWSGASVDDLPDDEDDVDGVDDE